MGITRRGATPPAGAGAGDKGNFGGYQRVIDPTLGATWQFLDEFLGELAGRFPDKYLHLGGDEVNVGLGRVVALYHHSSTSYPIH